MAINTPDAVPGELITASWGDNVRLDLQNLDSVLATRAADAAVVHKVGDTMTGTLQVGQNPTTDSNGVELWAAGRVTTCVNVPDSPNLAIRRTVSGSVVNGQPYGVFYRVGVGIGSITIASATTVAYNTTSDPRLKQQTGDVADAASLAAELGRAVFRGRWIDPATGEPEEGGDEWVMLSSHDVEDVAPFAVTGVRDAVDDDGNIVAQQVNYPALVPLLFAALGNALERIETLEGGAR